MKRQAGTSYFQLKRYKWFGKSFLIYLRVDMLSLLLFARLRSVKCGFETIVDLKFVLWMQQLNFWNEGGKAEIA